MSQARPLSQSPAAIYHRAYRAANAAVIRERNRLRRATPALRLLRRAQEARRRRLRRAEQAELPMAVTFTGDLYSQAVALVGPRPIGGTTYQFANEADWEDQVGVVVLALLEGDPDPTDVIRAFRAARVARERMEGELLE